MAVTKVTLLLVAVGCLLLSNLAYGQDEENEDPRERVGGIFKNKAKSNGVQQRKVVRNEKDRRPSQTKLDEEQKFKHHDTPQHDNAKTGEEMDLSALKDELVGTIKKGFETCKKFVSNIMEKNRKDGKLDFGDKLKKLVKLLPWAIIFFPIVILFWPIIVPAVLIWLVFF